MRIHEPRCISYTAHGALRPFETGRSASQDWSCQSYSRSHTIDAWRGGGSAKVAYGSAFSTPAPVTREWTRYLYIAPCLTPGMKPSQMPDASRGWSWFAVRFQPLKSPITHTLSALGAHTANVAPSPLRCAPSFS